MRVRMKVVKLAGSAALAVAIAMPSSIARGRDFEYAAELARRLAEEMRAAPLGFSTPEAAVGALITALRANDSFALDRLLQPRGRQALALGDLAADDIARRDFLTAYDRTSRLVRVNATTIQLRVGENDRPFPIPLTSDGMTWRFDVDAGL